MTGRRGCSELRRQRAGAGAGRSGAERRAEQSRGRGGAVRVKGGWPGRHAGVRLQRMLALVGAKRRAAAVTGEARVRAKRGTGLMLASRFSIENSFILCSIKHLLRYCNMLYSNTVDINSSCAGLQHNPMLRRLYIRGTWVNAGVTPNCFQ
jgi:hypothetical protein